MVREGYDRDARRKDGLLKGGAARHRTGHGTGHIKSRQFQGGMIQKERERETDRQSETVRQNGKQNRDRKRHSETKRGRRRQRGRDWGYRDYKTD